MALTTGFMMGGWCREAGETQFGWMSLRPGDVMGLWEFDVVDGGELAEVSVTKEMLLTILSREPDTVCQRDGLGDCTVPVQCI